MNLLHYVQPFSVLLPRLYPSTFPSNIYVQNHKFYVFISALSLCVHRIAFERCYGTWKRFQTYMKYGRTECEKKISLKFKCNFLHFYSFSLPSFWVNQISVVHDWGFSCGFVRKVLPLLMFEFRSFGCRREENELH